MVKNGKQDSESLLRALSETIRARRRTLKISQEDLSTSAGFARGYLSDIERGARSFSVKNLARLAQSLSLSPSALVRLAEQRIADSDTALDTTLDLKVVSALIGMNGTSLLVIDPNQDDKPVMYVSAGFERQFGCKRDEVIGKNFTALFRGENGIAGDCMETISKALDEKVSCTVKIKRHGKDGSALESALSLSPVFDDNGAVAYLVCLNKMA